jgi:hypothetical protein
MFLTEGTADDELASINRSSYLSFAYNEFTNHEGDLVVFGHSLDPGPIVSKHEFFYTKPCYHFAELKVSWLRIGFDGGRSYHLLRTQR